MSNQPPSWLPNKVPVNGKWEQVLRKLYSIFERDFVRDGCQFQNMPVWWDRRKMGNDQYEEGFWHLITKEERNSNTRLPDFRRAERLPWCKAVLINCVDPQVKVWNYQESSGKIRTYVWLEEFDYVVVLEEREQNWGTVVFLITAFYVDYESTKRNLRAKYTKREKS